MPDSTCTTVAPPTLLRLPEVKRRTGLGRTSIYSLAAKGQFPAPLKLSLRCSAWVSSEVDHWITERIERARRAEAPA